MSKVGMFAVIGQTYDAPQVREITSESAYFFGLKRRDGHPYDTTKIGKCKVKYFVAPENAGRVERDLLAAKRREREAVTVASVEYRDAWENIRKSAEKQP